MRLVFAGTPRFAETALAALLDAGHDIPLVLTQPDRPGGRGLRAIASPVKELAERRGLPVLQPQSLKSDAAVARVAQTGAEAMVVAAYGLILPMSALRATRRGAFNIHASLLPRWRGAAPIQRALLAGDERTGISIMKMDEGLDTGPVLLQRAIPICAEDDGGTLHDKLASLGAAMMIEVLARLDDLDAVAQPAEGATYARKIEKQDTVVDWSRPAEHVERMVRAYRPSPGATTRIGDDPLKIWNARARARREAEAGQVVAATDAGILVACGTGTLEILELQRAGGRRLSAAEFLRGRPLQTGVRLG